MRREDGLQFSGSQISSFHNSDNTHTRALRDGHVVDKGTASTSFFLLWKGETRKEEWIRNYVLLLKWQKGALDEYMKILKSERQDCLKELCYSMESKVCGSPHPPRALTCPDGD